MRRSCLVERHAAAGARIQDRSDPPFVLTYGDVPAEYEAATRRAAVFDETDRGLLRVSGTDAATFLHRILANDVRGLPPGAWNENLLLSPKGKVLHAFTLARDPGEESTLFRLSTEPGGAAPLAAALDHYLFSDDVRIEDRTEDSAPLAVVGPGSTEVVRAVLGPDVPEEALRLARVQPHGDLVLRGPVYGSLGYRIDGGPSRAGALFDALIEAGATPSGVVVRDILRVEAGAAWPGVDVDENVYPQEARLEPAFSLSKGCYVGQEVVAKIDTYQGLNKRLVALRIDHDDPVARGTRLVRDERDLGMVTSWAYSFVLDTGLVLAYVKRGHQDPGTEFQLSDGSGTAHVVALPVRAGALARE